MGKFKDLIDDMSFSAKFEWDNRNMNKSSGSGSVIKKMIENSPTMPTTMPTYDWELGRKAHKETRKYGEDFADRIHPLYGRFVKKVNNLEDTIENVVDSLNIGKVLLDVIFGEVAEKDLEIADSLYVQRPGFTHHGLYAGNGQVIHYTGDLADIGVGIMPAVQIDTIETFSGGTTIHRKSEQESPLRYSREQAVRRAYSRLGEQRYNLFDNNCDSFVNWCRFGGEESVY